MGRTYPPTCIRTGPINMGGGMCTTAPPAAAISSQQRSRGALSFTLAARKGEAPLRQEGAGGGGGEGGGTWVVGSAAARPSSARGVPGIWWVSGTWTGHTLWKRYHISSWDVRTIGFTWLVPTLRVPAAAAHHGRIDSAGAIGVTSLRGTSPAKPARAPAPAMCCPRGRGPLREAQDTVLSSSSAAN